MRSQRIRVCFACTGLASILVGLLLVHPAIGFTIGGAVMFWLGAGNAPSKEV